MGITTNDSRMSMSSRDGDSNSLLKGKGDDPHADSNSQLEGSDEDHPPLTIILGCE